MTLEEAIKHCEEVAQENEKQFNSCPMKYDGAYANNGKSACKCAEEHRQLAEWLKELKQLREQTRWIPVSEELPEFEKKVLCQCRAGIYEVLKYTSYGWYHDDTHCYMAGFVIAWMPLPEPYKAESES